MAELKTKKSNASVKKFLDSVPDQKKRQDSFVILDLMKKITKEKPKMCEPSIVGFGNYHYKYESGREGDWFITGFSPRKQNLTVYIMSGFKKFEKLLEKLGKYKLGKSCLYINKLEDVDIRILEKLVFESVKYMLQKYKNI